MTLRETLANLMASRHAIRPELAREHVARIDDEEVRRRFRYYSRERAISASSQTQLECEKESL